MDMLAPFTVTVLRDLCLHARCSPNQRPARVRAAGKGMTAASHHSPLGNHIERLEASDNAGHETVNVSEVRRQRYPRQGGQGSTVDDPGFSLPPRWAEHRVCVSYGFVETYITDPKHLKRIADKWKPLG
jgi:hypothetical protein